MPAGQFRPIVALAYMTRAFSQFFRWMAMAKPIFFVCPLLTASPSSFGASCRQMTVHAGVTAFSIARSRRNSRVGSRSDQQLMVVKGQL